jgi:ATP-binding protein involved in chromosome partitioning
MSYFTPEDMPEKKYFIFGKGATDELAKELDIPVLGRIPIVEKIVETGDSGSPIALDDSSIVTRAFKEIANNTEIQIQNLKN